METKFTKGEWKPEDHREHGDWRMSGNIYSVTGEFHNRLVCRVEPIGNILNEKSIEEFHANINLLSSAPELYEALERMLKDWNDHIQLPVKTVMDAEAALKKARGNQ